MYSFLLCPATRLCKHGCISQCFLNSVIGCSAATGHGLGELIGWAGSLFCQKLQRCWEASGLDEAEKQPRGTPEVRPPCAEKPGAGRNQ